MDAGPDRNSILFIDDNHLLLTTIGHLLTELGFRLLPADNAFAGLCALLQHRPQQVFIDGNARRLSGFEFCLLVKRQAQCRHTPVILVLEDYHPAQEAKARAAGAAGILLKPFGGEELQKLLPAWAGKDRTEQGKKGATQPETGNAETVSAAKGSKQ